MEPRYDEARILVKRGMIGWSRLAGRHLKIGISMSGDGDEAVRRFRGSDLTGPRSLGNSQVPDSKKLQLYGEI